MTADRKTAWQNAGRRFVLLCCASLCAGPGFVQAQSPTNISAQASDQLLNKRGSITLRNVTLADALFTISETWKVNLLFGQDVTGEVNGAFRDVTLREVLDSLLLANGYGYRPRGQSLIIMKLEALGDTNAMLQTDVVSLPGSQASDIVEAARMFLSPQGKLQAIPSVGSLMIRDYPENIKRIEKFVQSVNSFKGQTSQTAPPADTVLTLLPGVRLPGVSPSLLPEIGANSGTSVVYFTPRHTKAESLRESFETVLGPLAKVVVVTDENRIAVVDTQEGIELARKIFNELDQPRAQVRITALIYDVNVEELEQLGVNWTHNARASINSAGAARHSFGGKFGPLTDPAADAFSVGGALANAATATAASTASLGAAQVMTLNKYFDLGGIISALDQTDGARLLADPTVTVIDREEASIRIVTEIPIQQLTQTSEGGSIGTTTFRDAGVTLTVTPQVGADGTITMNVTPSFSVLSGFSEGQPIIDSREASTTVRITDGQTIVIGGLRQRSEVETTTGIPRLMSWKRVGKLFRSHSTTIRESELMVFLRPEIVYLGAVGTDRQMAGLCVAHQALARLNWPSDAPVIPTCNDPHCPYHHPEPRIAPSVHSNFSVSSPANTLTQPQIKLGPIEKLDDNKERLQPLPNPFLPPPIEEHDGPAEPLPQSFHPIGAKREASGAKQISPWPKVKRISHVKVEVPAPIEKPAATTRKRTGLWPRWLQPIKDRFSGGLRTGATNGK